MARVIIGADHLGLQLKDALAGLYASHRKYLPGPSNKQGGNKELLIHLRGRSGHLSQFMLVHGSSSGLICRLGFSLSGAEGVRLA